MTKAWWKALRPASGSSRRLDLDQEMAPGSLVRLQGLRPVVEVVAMEMVEVEVVGSLEPAERLGLVWAGTGDICPHPLVPLRESQHEVPVVKGSQPFRCGDLQSNNSGFKAQKTSLFSTLSATWSTGTVEKSIHHDGSGSGLGAAEVSTFVQKVSQAATRY